MDANKVTKAKVYNDFHNPNFDFPHFTKTYVVEQHGPHGEVLQQVLVTGCAGPVDAMCKAKLDDTSRYGIGYRPITVHAYEFVGGRDVGDEVKHGMAPPTIEVTE